ncbi:hypothetical protein [Actinomadura fibrosa]|uniref:Uncharacterized protein n=1 Tax=Actinomadura fibrosa TaxID=111802 RepID=A0ABW2XGM1_9ACTN|nr:hypothetical protein [Actinomadura fibrosa]
MSTPFDPADRALAELRADFPSHRIWRSTRRDGRLGDWVATLHDPTAGVDPTVVRGSADDLRTALQVERVRAAARPGAARQGRTAR